MRFLMVLLLLLGALGLGAHASGALLSAAQEGEFELERVQFRLSDVDGRPYQLSAGEAELSARLLGAEENKELEGQTEITAENMTYPVGGDGLPFKIEGDVATVAFVVFKDTARNPVHYELSLRTRQDGEPRLVPLQSSTFAAGATSPDEPPPAAIDLTSTERAPQTWEWAALAGIGVTGLIFAWLVLGRVLFRRMLFHGRMSVGAALTISNLLLLGAVILLAVTVVLAWLFPMVNGQVPYQGYFVAAGGYLLALALAWGLGSLAFNR